VVLLGGTVAAAFHWASHLIDRHHGGTAADPWLTGAFAVLLLAGLVLQLAPHRDHAQADVPAVSEGARK
jgi:hypothetical protein